VENDNHKNQPVFSKKIRAGKRRTYFIDVRTTRSNDYYLTLTESTKRFNGDGCDRHKLFLYKEDFNKFVDALKETVDHVKTDLMPEYDFDEFTKKEDIQGDQSQNANWVEGDYSETAEEKAKRQSPVKEQDASPEGEPQKESTFQGTDNVDTDSSDQQETEQSNTDTQRTEGFQSSGEDSSNEEAMRWD